MATLESVQKRIESYEAQIAKSENIILKHQKSIDKKQSKVTKETDKDKIEILEDGIDTLKEKIKEHNKKIDNLKEKIAVLLKQKDELDIKRDNPVLIEFLDAWKKRIEDLYHNSYKELKENASVLYKEYEEGCEEAKKRAEEESKGEKYYIKYKLEDLYISETYKKIYGKFSSVLKYCNYVSDPIFNEEKFQKDIRKDYNAKYDMIISRVNFKIGKIIKASLFIAMNGELNGEVEGEKGTCKVETIGAGGYNIQRYHFRVLVK